MKILHIDYDDLQNPYAAGGQAYTTAELMQRLAKRHEITVVTGNYPGAKNKKIHGVQYIRLGLGNAGYTASMLSHWFLLPFYVFLNQKKYDIILECFTAPFTVSFVPLVAKKPLIALPSFFDSQKLAEKYHIPLDIFLTTLIKKYKQFITLTDDLGKRVKKLNPHALCTTIPGGISEEILNSRIGKGEYVLYLGRIDIYNKGLRFLLQAWQSINQHLIIAGSGKESDENELKTLIHRYKLEKKVTFVGRVVGNKKVDLYKNSLFVVQPSLFETFGYVALETLASGKLLVCFDIPGFRWIPKKCAIKVAPFDTKHLQQAIQKTLRAKKLMKNAEKNNRSFAKKFTWDHIAQQYEDALRKVL